MSQNWTENVSLVTLEKFLNRIFDWNVLPILSKNYLFYISISGKGKYTKSKINSPFI